MESQRKLYLGLNKKLESQIENLLQDKSGKILTRPKL